jgi:hypothetical protein
VKVRVKAHPPVDGVQGIEVWKKYKIGKKEVRHTKIEIPGGTAGPIVHPGSIAF